MGTRFDLLRWGWIAAISAGCTTLAGIDEDYVPIGVSGTAGTRSNAGAGGDFGGSGGADGTGGSMGGAAATNGASGSGGGAGSGGSGGVKECAQNLKPCGDECVTSSVANGCAPDRCEPCPIPTIEHVEVWCNSEHNCDVRCAPGYVPDSGRCVPEGTVGSGGTGSSGGSGGSAGGGTGGAGGTAGTTGSGGTTGVGGTTGAGGTGGTGRCSPSTCPSCPLPDGKIPCCTLGGKCGCGYPVVGAFYCI